MTMSDPIADESLDALTLRCPEPLLLARNRLRNMTVGQVLYIQATDPSTARDFQNLCRFMGHTMLLERTSGDTLEYWIKKG
jgi:tRNA 2-thiouridine synthesizing protein A